MANRRARNQTAESSVAELPPETVAPEQGDESTERKPFPKRRPWEHSNDAGVERSTYSDRDKKISESRSLYGNPGKSLNLGNPVG